MFRGNLRNQLLVLGLSMFYGSCGPAHFEGGGPTRVSKTAAPNPTSHAGEGDAVAADELGMQSHEEVFTALGPEYESLIVSDDDVVEQSFMLTSEGVEVEQKAAFVQVERKQVTKSFSQGSVGAESVESFSQSELGVVDILVVIDSSRSMGEEQAKVASRLPELISEINDANWQIRIVTTDPAQSCTRRLIKKSDVDPITTFKDAILDIGVLGSGDERGVQTAIAGLQCSEAWIRPNSNLAVLIVSDEDNCSNGDCSYEPIANNNPETLKQVLVSQLGGSKRILGDDARIYGLFKVPGDASCTTAYAEATVYRDLVVDTKGVYGSICDDDYSSTLTQISRDIRSQLKLTFSLNHIPDLGTTLLMIDGKTLVAGVDYVVSGRSVRFVVPPRALSTITAVYRYGGSPLAKQFDLGEDVGQIEELRLTKPDGFGEVVDEAEYQVNGSVLIFEQIPAEGSEIRVAFRQKQPQLVQVFKIAKHAMAASIRATIDGEPVAVRYDAATGEVELAREAADLQKIEISYKLARLGNPLLRYQASLDYSQISDLTAIDEVTGAGIPVHYDGEGFVFEPEEFSEGRRVKLSYKLPGAGRVHKQEKLKEANQVFTVEAHESHADGDWVVFVDDQETRDYEREGRRVVFKKPLAQGSRVRVKVDHRGKH